MHNYQEWSPLEGEVELEDMVLGELSRLEAHGTVLIEVKR